MVKFFRNLKNKQIVLFIIIDLLIGAGIVTLYFFKLIPEIVLTIGVFLVLITSSSFSSMLMSRHFQKKLDKKRRGKLYQVNDELKLKGKVKEFEVNYGKVQSFFESKNIYNLSYITNPEIFFSDDQENIKLNIDETKYNKSIQFFVFDSKRMDLYRKISILNYQAKRFYVASFMYDSDSKTIYQTDAVMPSEDFQKLYKRFIQLLDLEEKVEN